MKVEFVDVPLSDVCACIASETDRRLFTSVMDMFVDNGLTYKVKVVGPDAYRVYCFIKKSKEAVIMNTNGYGATGFAMQLRIKDPSVFERLEGYSNNVRNLILGGRDCRSPHCCNCGSWYSFSHNGTEYRKCHMLCDNFRIHGLAEEDHESVMSIISDEIAHGKPRGRK